jgi:hypothetical protein
LTIFHFEVPSFFQILLDSFLSVPSSQFGRFFTLLTTMHIFTTISFLHLALSSVITALPATSESAQALDSLEHEIVPRGTKINCAGWPVTISSQKIGSGGIGDVYEGTLVEAGGKIKECAVKQFRTHSQDFFDGYLLGKRIKSSNLMSVWATCRVSGRSYAVTEIVPGRSSGKYESRFYASESNLRRIFRGWVHGLSVLHSQGVAHADVKPDNVMVNFDVTEVIVIDYDLLTTRREDRDVCGTPPYMSPGS